MIDLTLAPAGDVIALDLWTGDAPALDGIRHIRVEPRRWWLFDAAAQAEAIAARLGDGGAMAAIGGGLIRVTLTGPGWRGLLMVSGQFDAEDSAFGPGQLAATVIHHVPVWIVPAASDACDVYFASSYAPGIMALWANAAATPSRATPPPR